MSPSIQRDLHGPDWPLGFVAIVTPGSPVGFMSVADPAGLYDPINPNSEYAVRCTEIMIQGVKPGAASHGTQFNTGNVYVVRKGVGANTGNRDDSGSIVGTVQPGQTLFLSAAALNRNVWNPYRYSIDGDNAGDGVFVTLIVQ